jgi:prephenate dehydrogenase/cyclohexadieny/prephenate dehydrogenase
MTTLNNVLVIGLGMMGASLCSSIRKNKLSKNIIGYDLSKRNLNYAKKKKVIDEALISLPKINNPDLIILCSPLSTYANITSEIVKYTSKKIILTDIGSSKGKITSNIYKLIAKSKVEYLSSHPMAGSEKTGPSNLISDMFRNKVVFLIDKTKCSKSTYIRLSSFWKSLGSHTYDLDKNEHDILMSETSHISHLMSYVFMHTLPQRIINNNLSLLLGGGIKEHVRLSQSSSEMWTDIFINNKNNLRKSIARIEKNLNLFRKLINDSDEKKIMSILKKINNKTR